METPSPSSSSSNSPSGSFRNLSLNSENIFPQAASRTLIIKSLLDQQPDCELITTLPVEILVHIIKQIKDPATFSKLSDTCQGFKALVGDNYQHQCTQFIKELATPVTDFLRADNDGIITNVAIPAIHTDEWKKLRYHAMDQNLTREEQIQRMYITAWDLLMQPVGRENREYARRLMKILVDIAPYISNSGVYTAALFPRFPSLFFTQLANVHLERCLHLIIQHFPINEDSPAYQFIKVTWSSKIIHSS